MYTRFQRDHYKDFTYAISEIGGRQLWLEVGRIYKVNRLAAKKGSRLRLNRVLFLNFTNQNSNKSAEHFLFGRPYLRGTKVMITILGHIRGKKLTSFQMRPKKKTKRTIGHRQYLTKFIVDSK